MTSLNVSNNEHQLSPMFTMDLMTPPRFLAYNKKQKVFLLTDQLSQNLHPLPRLLSRFLVSDDITTLEKPQILLLLRNILWITLSTRTFNRNVEKTKLFAVVNKICCCCHINLKIFPIDGSAFQAFLKKVGLFLEDIRLDETNPQQFLEWLDYLASAPRSVAENPKLTALILAKGDFYIADLDDSDKLKWLTIFQRLKNRGYEQSFEHAAFTARPFETLITDTFRTHLLDYVERTKKIQEEMTPLFTTLTPPFMQSRFENIPDNLVVQTLYYLKIALSLYKREGSTALLEMGGGGIALYCLWSLAFAYQVHDQECAESLMEVFMTSTSNTLEETTLATTLPPKAVELIEEYSQEGFPFSDVVIQSVLKFFPTFLKQHKEKFCTIMTLLMNNSPEPGFYWSKALEPHRSRVDVLSFLAKQIETEQHYLLPGAYALRFRVYEDTITPVERPYYSYIKNTHVAMPYPSPL